MLEVLKSRYITGLSASSWRKARPLAAPNAIFILIDHGRGKDPAKAKFSTERQEIIIKSKKHLAIFEGTLKSAARSYESVLQNVTVDTMPLCM